MVFDFAVIGSGAGGSTAFRELCSSGAKTILIEEGNQTGARDLPADVPKLFSQLYRDGGLRAALGTPSISIGEGSAIGGTTELNGGLFWSLPSFICEEWKRLGVPSEFVSEILKETENLKNEFNVQLESLIKNENNDSRVLLNAARKLGIAWQPAPRLAAGCRRTNICPVGCGSDSKITMSKSLIPEGLAHGGILKSGNKVQKVSLERSILRLSLSSGEELYAKECLISCGAIEGQRLLRRSNLLPSRHKYPGASFHANLKIIAEFPFELKSFKSTVFTHQVHEYMNEGILLMPTNFNLGYLALASGHLTSAQFKNLWQKKNKLAMYTAQVRVKGKISDLRGLGEFTDGFLRVRWHPEDYQLMANALILLGELIFEGGASSLILPIFPSTMKSKSDNIVINSQSELRRKITPSLMKKASVQTVHLMSTFPLFSSRLIDEFGYLKDNYNSSLPIRLMDASILPSTTCESPQATIMSIVRTLLKRKFSI